VKLVRYECERGRSVEAPKGCKIGCRCEKCNGTGNVYIRTDNSPVVRIN
jgi:hypothetical protein